MVKIKNIEKLKYEVLPLHDEVFAREIWGLNTGATNVVVRHNVNLAHGGAVMHVHDGCEHIFYILSGKLKVKTDKEEDIFGPGEAFVILPGEPHEVGGTGEEDCVFINITTPPPSYTEPYQKD